MVRGLKDDVHLEGVVEVNAQVLQRCAEALRRPNFEEYCQVLRCVGRAVNKQGTRLEGCSCHEHILDGPGDYKKLQQFRKETEKCIWKMAWGPELASGLCEKMCARIQCANDPWLGEAYSKSSPETRCAMVTFERKLKNCAAANITAKLAMFEFLPFKIFGLYAHERGTASLEETIQAGRNMCREYDEAAAAGREDKVHRVAKQFLSKSGPHRARLEQWMDSGSPLREFPDLAWPLKLLALTPVVCRRIEASHAEYHWITKKMSNFKFAWAACSMRRGDVLKAREKSERFDEFLESNWRRRDVFGMALQCIVPKEEWRALGRMSKDAKLGMWYQCSVQAQFRNMFSEVSEHAKWLKEVKSSLLPAAAMTGTAGEIICKFVKSMCDVRGVIFCLPKEIVQAELEPNRGRQNALGFYDELDRFMKEERIMDKVPPRDRRDCVFFEVVNPYPERKHLMRPAHLDYIKGYMQVVEYTYATSERGEMLLRENKEDPILNGHLNIACLCDLRALSKLRRLDDVSTESVGVRLPRRAAGALENLHHMVNLSHTFSAMEADSGLSCSSMTAAAVDLINLLDQRRAISTEPRTAVPVLELNTSVSVLAVLKEHNIIERYETGFGEEGVALVPCSCPPAIVTKVSTKSLSILNVRLRDEEVPNSFKMCLILELQKRGWTSAYNVNEHSSTSPKVYSQTMVMRSTLYFCALFRLQEVLNRGARSVLTGLPHYYYQCLLELPNYSPLLALTDDELRGLGNNGFHQMLKGKKPTFLAIEDPMMNHDDPQIIDGEAETIPAVLSIMDAPIFSGVQQQHGSSSSMEVARQPASSVDHGVSAAAAEVTGNRVDEMKSLHPISVKNFSLRFSLCHASGKPRAYIKCPNANHGVRCEKWRQLNQDTTFSRCCAHLLAWADVGHVLDEYDHKDPFLVLPPGNVDHWETLFKDEHPHLS